jgi:hypothetical protein
MAEQTADKHAWLGYAYVGPNPAHLRFRQAVANEKVFVVMISRAKAQLFESFKEDMKTRAQQGERFSVGIITQANEARKQVQGIFLPYNESLLATSDFDAWLSQIWAKVYTSLHRMLVTYLMDIYGEIARKDPRILKSRRTITFDDVIEAHQTNELVDLMIERQQTALSHMDREQLASEFESIGLSLLVQGEDAASFAATARAFEEFWPNRNILEHNRGVVNRLYLQKNPRSERRLGDCVVVNMDMLGKAFAMVQAVAESVNKRAIEKFAIG